MMALWESKEKMEGLTVKDKSQAVHVNCDERRRNRKTSLSS